MQQVEDGVAERRRAELRLSNSPHEREVSHLHGDREQVGQDDGERYVHHDPRLLLPSCLPRPGRCRREGLAHRPFFTERVPCEFGRLFARCAPRVSARRWRGGDG